MILTAIGSGFDTVVRSGVDTLLGQAADSLIEILVPSAHAQAGGAGGSPAFSLIMIVGMFAVFYFLLIRPQQKRQKEHRAMIEALAKGEEVITNGGLLGKVTDLNDNFVTLEIAKGAEVKVQRQAIANVVPKGTIKSA